MLPDSGLDATEGPDPGRARIRSKVAAVTREQDRIRREIEEMDREAAQAADPASDDDPHDEFDPQPAPEPEISNDEPQPLKLQPPTLSPKTPSRSAHEFIKRQSALMRFWRGDFYLCTGTVYEQIEDVQVSAEVRWFLDHALMGNGRPFETRKNHIAEIIDALQSYLLVPSATEPGQDRDLISFKNGVLRVSTKELEPHDPNRFTLHCLPFDYDPILPPPTEWLKFLHTLWPGRDDYIELLQEMFGYFISGRTDLQKILTLIGPARSGKGTIAFVLRRLLGNEYVADLTMDKFGKDFGLQVLIGKTMLIIPDARVGRINLIAVTERLLNISGEDPMSISRKYKEDWQGMLGTRIVIMSNEIPRLPDATGTIATRFVPIRMFRSFLGREDTELKNKLIPELPQIMNWALTGLDRLNERGHFEIPEDAMETINDIREAASPLIEFTEDYLIEDGNATTFKQRVYDAYRGFALSKGYQVMSDGRFASELKALMPALKDYRPRVNGEQGPRMWKGIRLADPNSPKFTSPYNDIYDDEGEVYVPPGRMAKDDHEIFH